MYNVVFFFKLFNKLRRSFLLGLALNTVFRQRLELFEKDQEEESLVFFKQFQSQSEPVILIN